MKKYINIWTILILALTVAGIVLACKIGAYWFITWALWAGLATFFLYLTGVERREMVANYEKQIKTLTEEKYLYRGKYDRQLTQFDEVQHQLDQVKHEFLVYKREHPETEAKEETIQVTAADAQKKTTKKKKSNE